MQIFLDPFIFQSFTAAETSKNPITRDLWARSFKTNELAQEMVRGSIAVGRETKLG
jgi:hypothetical protein